MVEIFKTNIADGAQAGLVLQRLKEQWPQYMANFDLEDCDRILRIESDSVDHLQIVSMMHVQGYVCEVLN
jgi:3-methyladenine DNA glycosylase Tag